MTDEERVKLALDILKLPIDDRPRGHNDLIKLREDAIKFLGDRLKTKKGGGTV